MRLRDSLNILLALCVCAVGAQTLAGVAQPNVAPPTASVSPPADSWGALSKNQQSALAPLEKSWSTLSDGHRRKWIALAANFHDLATPEREKLHSRMAEWAALSPKDREAARLNFAQSKGIAKSDRAANWEAYQALSPDERAKLANGAKAKPVGAAVTIKPVAPEKLTPVPITRHTPEQERAAAASQRPQNRSTLLPQAPTTAAAPVATLSQP